MIDSLKPTLNLDLIAGNIRGWRMIRGFSQAELAKRAGVGITTIYKAELGKPVRLNSLKKIVEVGLQGLLEEAATTRKFANTKQADELFVKHNQARTTWFVYGDQRRRVPEENLELIQDQNERIRLGRLGLAYLFGCGLDFLMPDGPGMLFYEVHGPTDPVTQNYRDAIYYAMRGSVQICFGEESVCLQEGESIGCDGRSKVTFDLVEPLALGQLPPVVQYIGANRIGKTVKPRKRSQ